MRLRKSNNKQADTAFAIRDLDKEIARWEKAIRRLPEGPTKEEAKASVARDIALRDRLLAGLQVNRE